MAYLTIAPLLVVAFGALLGVLIEAIVPRRARFAAQTWCAVIIILVAVGFTGRNWWGGETTRHLAGFGSVSVDAATLLIWAGLLAFALGAVVLAAQRFEAADDGGGAGVSSFAAMAVASPGSAEEREAEATGGEHTEVFPLMMFALTGMLLFPAASDLLTAFIGLEVLSLPLYLLTALARRRRLISHEAALKYFLLGAFSSAVYLYGAALVYGFASGSDYCDTVRKAAGEGLITGCGADFRSIDVALANSLGSDPVLLAGFGLLMIGLLFKVGAVPFHAWVPDTYTGAPTPVTAYMAVGTKVASFGALVRLLYVAFGGLQWTWLVPLAIVAALTMAVGSIFGLTQTNIKRLLAYSSIAHAGFVLAPIAAAVGVTTIDSLSSMTAVVYYLAAYGLATLGAFAVVMVVRDGTGEAMDLAAWAGIGRRHPWVGAAMTLFLCSLAGIPATAGFIGKLDAFVVAWRGGLWWLVLLALVFSLVAMVFYMRVVLTIWFIRRPEEPPAPAGDDDELVGSSKVEAQQPSVGRVPVSLVVLMTVCAAGTLVAGLFPGLFTHVASLAAQLLR